MKNYILLFFLFSSTILFGQTADSLGTGNNSFLNKFELAYFDSIFEKAPETSFKDQKIVFIDHRSSPIIISKKEFFDLFIKPHRNTNKLPNFSTRDVKSDEKKQSGGYDFIFISPSGSLSSEERSKIFKELESNKK